MLNVGHYDPPKQLLSDRAILITGATGTLGTLCSLQFASYGAKLIIQGRSNKKLNNLYDQIIRRGEEPLALAIDFTSSREHDFFQIARDIEEQFGQLDGIVHCAVAAPRLAKLQDNSYQSWLITMAVNYFAPTYITNACMPLLKESKDGSIIYMSETHAQMASPFWGQFSSSKAAIESIAKTQAGEFARNSQLRCNIVVPGPIRTNSQKLNYPGKSEDEFEDPEEAVKTLLYLIGPDSAEINGKKIIISN